MHGLINRSLQCFLRDTYGLVAWRSIAAQAGIGAEGFEPLLIYDDSLTDAVLAAAAVQLRRPRDTVLEDLGTYLVSHKNLEPVRRLLRFGGVSFLDFLQSMEELPEHARLGLPDLDLPQFKLIETGNGEFMLEVTPLIAGAGHVIVGLLRAMADDYGTLAMVDHAGPRDGVELVQVLLLDHAYTAGRSFELALSGGVDD